MLILLLKIICTVYHMIVQIVKSRGWLEKVLIIPKFVFQFKLNYSFRLIQMYKRHLPVRFIGMDYCSGARSKLFYPVWKGSLSRWTCIAKVCNFGPKMKNMNQVVEIRNLGPYSSFLDQNMHTFAMNFQNGIMNSLTHFYGPKPGSPGTCHENHEQITPTQMTLSKTDSKSSRFSISYVFFNELYLFFNFCFEKIKNFCRRSKIDCWIIFI